MIPLPLCHSPLELETKVLKHFTIMEKAPTKAFSWLKAPTNTFTFETLLRLYDKWAVAKLIRG